MKNISIPSLIIVFIAMLTFAGQAEAIGSVGYQHKDETMACDDTKVSMATSLTIEPVTLRINAEMVKFSSSENVKNYDKLIRYKFYDKENQQVKKSAGRYILYSHTLPFHHPDLNELRRLNV